MPNLFDPLPIRSVTLPNRIVVSPMCEYSSTDGSEVAAMQYARPNHAP